MFPSRLDDPKIERAFKIVERGRFCKNLARLRRTVGPIMQHLRDRKTLGEAFPLLGVLDGLRERGAFDPALFPESYSFSRRRKLRFSNWLVDHYGRWLFQHLQRRFPDRPGWNDYLLIRWCMTGSENWLHRIYSRAVAIPLPDSSAIEYSTAATCRWMVASFRAQHADFDAGIQRLEEHYGQPVTAAVAPFPTGEFVTRNLPPGYCSRCRCAVNSRDFCNCPCHALPRPHANA